MLDLDTLAPLGSPERDLLEQLDSSRVPRHVAFIMDGNGRWAQARGLPRVEGHRNGIKAVKDTVETAARVGIEVATLYAFSTENWKRPRYEVLTLMTLLKEYIDLELENFVAHNLRMRPIGRLEELDRSVQKKLQRAVDATKNCTGMIVQIALNYSGRQELTDTIRSAVASAASGKLAPESVDEGWISDHLLTAGTPDPDLLIRTSGEQRISNFLLWQLAYSEIYFAPVLWPDFGRVELIKALLEYQNRERRFGGLPSQEEDVFSRAEEQNGSP